MLPQVTPRVTLRVTPQVMPQVTLPSWRSVAGIA